VLDKAAHDASPQLQHPDRDSVRRGPASLCDGRHRFGGFAVLRKSLILQQKSRLTSVNLASNLLNSVLKCCVFNRLERQNATRDRIEI
jgi:hypothetical protein